MGGARFVRVDLNVVEQRYRVALEELEGGLRVTEGAMRDPFGTDNGGSAV